MMKRLLLAVLSVLCMQICAAEENVPVPEKPIGNAAPVPVKLDRMTVGTFQAKNSGCEFYGKKLSAQNWIGQFTDALNTRLTQSRKFTILDRAFEKDVNAELARLVEPNAAPADVIRLNQKLATDYLIVGYVTFSDVVAGGTNSVTGEALPPASSVFATVHYRVICAPTGQMKWSDTFTVDSTYFAQSLYAGNLSDSADYAASGVSAGILSCIFPFEVVKVIGEDSVVIGEGGKSIIEGEYLSVYVLGEEVKDTRTGKLLDRIEIPVGVVQITRVTEKLSYAKIVKGDAKKITVGARLRRDSLSGQAGGTSSSVSAPAENPSQVRGSEGGGVVVPF